MLPCVLEIRGGYIFSGCLILLWKFEITSLTEPATKHIKLLKLVSNPDHGFFTQ